MAVPDFQSLMRPVLAAAAEQPIRMPDIVAELADSFELSTEEREELLPSGRQRLFYNRLAWAKFHLAKAEMISSPSRGSFVATPAGKALLKAAPERIDMAILRRRSPSYAKMLAGEKNGNSGTGLEAEPIEADISTPTDEIAAAVKLLREKLKIDLREQIAAAGPARFERLIRDLLVAMQYGEDLDADGRRAGGSDGGVDGVISQDKLGLDRIYLQAKLYTDAKIGRPAIQGFVGSLLGHGASKGVFVTMTSFSKEATAYAAGLRERIVLIDGDRLCDLLIEHGVGVRDERPIVIKQIDYSYFTDEG